MTRTSDFLTFLSTNSSYRDETYSSPYTLEHMEQFENLLSASLPDAYKELLAWMGTKHAFRGRELVSRHPLFISLAWSGEQLLALPDDKYDWWVPQSSFSAIIRRDLAPSARYMRFLIGEADANQYFLELGGRNPDPEVLYFGDLASTYDDTERFLRSHNGLALASTSFSLFLEDIYIGGHQGGAMRHLCSNVVGSGLGDGRLDLQHSSFVPQSITTSAGIELHYEPLNDFGEPDFHQADSSLRGTKIESNHQFSLGDSAPIFANSRDIRTSDTRTLPMYPEDETETETIFRIEISSLRSRGFPIADEWLVAQLKAGPTNLQARGPLSSMQFVAQRVLLQIVGDSVYVRLDRPYRTLSLRPIGVANSLS